MFRAFGKAFRNISIAIKESAKVIGEFFEPAEDPEKALLENLKIHQIRDLDIPLEFNDIVELQDMLYSLDVDSIDEQLPNFEKFLDHISFEDILTNIYSFASVCPRKNIAYADLITHLVKITNKTIDPRMQNYKLPFLLRMLYNAKIFTVCQIEEIIEVNPDFNIFFSDVLNLDIPDADQYRDFGYKIGSIECALKTDNQDALHCILAQPGFDSSVTFKTFKYDFPEQFEVDILSFAALYGSTKCFKYLIINGYSVSEDTGKCAISGGSLEIVQICSQKGCTFDGALKSSVKFYQNEIFDWVLLQNVCYGVSVLTIATTNNVNAALFFIENEFDIDKSTDKKWNSPLHVACANGNSDVAKVILYKSQKNLNEKNKEGETPLFLASKRGVVSLVKYLLEHGARKNETDNNYTLPLHVACNSASLELVEMLFDKKNVNNKNYFDMTPLHFASMGGSGDIVRFLIRNGANVNAKTKASLIFGDEIGGRTPLHLACQEGSTSCAAELIASGADINSRDSEDDTPLHRACLSKNAYLVTFLLSNKAYPNPKNKQNRTPLFYATDKESIDIIDALMKNNANINAIDKDGNTVLINSILKPIEVTKKILEYPQNTNIINNRGMSVLHYIAKKGYTERACLVVAAGGDVNIRNSNKVTPLMFAAERSHPDLIKALIEMSADISLVDNNRSTALHYASKANSLQSVTELVNAGASINSRNADGDTPLLMANSYDVISFFITAGADINATNNMGQAIVHIASSKGNLNVINLLDAAGANFTLLDNNNDSPLVYAIKGDNDIIITRLIQLGCPVNSASKFNLMSPLHYAVETNDVQIIMDLIANGAIVDSLDYQRRTPLMHAAMSYGNKVGLITELIGSGANVNARDDEGDTPLYFAVFNSNFDVAKCLIDNGAKVNITNDKGWTPLYIAAKERKKEYAELLVEAGADPNIADRDGNTPLMMAAKEGDREICEFLIRRRGRVNQTNHQGLTALHFAAKENHTDVIRFLCAEGANRRIADNSGRFPYQLSKPDSEAMQILLI